jgi:hypothetical protein
MNLVLSSSSLLNCSKRLLSMSRSSLAGTVEGEIMPQWALSDGVMLRRSGARHEQEKFACGYFKRESRRLLCAAAARGDEKVRKRVTVDVVQGVEHSFHGSREQ